MARYTYEAVVSGDLNDFNNTLMEMCDGDKGRVVSSNAFYDHNEKQTMFYGLVQVFSYYTRNPDYQVIEELETANSNLSSIDSNIMDR